jgi:hypothetical protein
VWADNETNIIKMLKDIIDEKAKSADPVWVKKATA